MAVDTILYLKEKRPTDYIRTEEIARSLNYSLGYLQKVIQTLGKYGTLDCKRGRIGGVRIRAKMVTVLDLWEITCGSLDSTDPPLDVMEKPVKAFRDALKKAIIYKR